MKQTQIDINFKQYVQKYFNCCEEMAETLIISAEINGESDVFCQMIGYKGDKINV